MGRPVTFQKVSGAPIVFVTLAVLVGIAVFIVLNRCTPTPFFSGQRIELGPGVFIVSTVEATSSGNETQLAVFYRWTRAETAPASRHPFWDRPRLTLVDAQGESFGPASHMDAAAYRWLRDREASEGGDTGSSEEGRLPEEWVASFVVPREGRSFSLVATNPSRREGQPCAAIVSLGRY